MNSNVDYIMPGNNSQAIANMYGGVLGSTTMSILASSLEPRSALSISTLEETSVTRVKKGPLFALSVMNLAYTTVGSYLTLKAMRLAKSRDVVDIHARLSLEGLVAEGFEDKRYLNKKSRKSRKSNCCLASCRGKETGDLASSLPKRETGY